MGIFSINIPFYLAGKYLNVTPTFLKYVVKYTEHIYYLKVYNNLVAF